MTTTRRVLLFALPAALITALVVSWPPQLSLSALASAPSRLAGAGQPLLPSEWRDVVANILVFAPFGWVLGRVTRSLGATLISAAALSAAIELSQLIQPGRIISAADLLANSLGALVGGWLALRLVPLLGRVRARGVHPVAFALAGPVVAAVAYAAMESAYGRFDAWHADFPLNVNNEATGDRPWCGDVLALSIRAGARTWRLEDFALSARDSVAGCGATVWRQTDVPPRELSIAIREAHAFRLETTLRSLDPDQAGPARIVSLSTSPGARNVTLGQDGRDLVLRLRRTGTGANGLRPSYRLAGVLADSSVLDVTLEAGPRRTYFAAGVLVADHRVWLARDWWMLLLPRWEWRPSAWHVLLAVPFWAALMALPGALTGAAAAGRNIGMERTAVLSIIGAGAAFVVLRVTAGSPPAETLPIIGGVLLLSSWLARSG